VTVTYVPGSDAHPPRVAYAVGRAVGGAVVRNRLRRRLRAVMTELGPHLRSGTYLVGAAPEAANVPFGALREMVSGAVEAASGRARR
jgi:ribonuclease P protein component